MNELTARIHQIEHLLLPEIISLICNDKITLINKSVSFNLNSLKNDDYIIKNYEV